jgi:hypothetical protein
MATGLHSDPELVAAVDRARREAQRAGELRSSPPGRLDDFVDPEARAALARWVASGGYERALAEVVADDPDLADQ